MNSMSSLSGVFAGDDTLYVTGSYVVALLLVLIEVAIVYLRGRAILGYLGWDDGFRFCARPDEPGAQ